MTYQLHLGDCIEGMRAMADKSVDHVIADPPYGKRTHSGQRHGRRGKGYKDSWVSAAGLSYDHLDPETLKALAAEYVRIARKWILVMTSHDLFPLWEASLGRYSFAPIPIVMPGMNVRLAGDGPSSWSVWMVVNRPVGLKDGTKPGAYVGSPGVGPERAENPVKGHKPLWLLKAILQDYTAPGDSVLDSHTGSGTTAAACIELGRRFIGFENKESNYNYATARLARCVVDLGEVQRQGLLALPKPKQLTLSSDLDLP